MIHINKIISICNKTHTTILKDYVRGVPFYYLRFPDGKAFRSNNLDTIHKHIRSRRFYWDRDKMLSTFPKYNNKTFVRVIKAILDLQTKDELMVNETWKSNGVGFDRIDAPYFHRMMSYYNEHGYLPKDQIHKCKGKMTRYWRQLCDLAMKKFSTPTRS